MKNSNRPTVIPDELKSCAYDPVYVLTLYVTATTPRSVKAIANIRKLCEEHLNGRYELEIVDISKDPAAAKVDQLIAAPTLIKRLPLPLRRFIGDMSDTKRLAVGLDIR